MKLKFKEELIELGLGIVSFRGDQLVVISIFSPRFPCDYSKSYMDILTNIAY